ncbi:hypothetical protein ACFSTC_27160 [Nonomuraea ferruginea]
MSDAGRRRGEHQPDEQTGRARDHHDPDVAVIERAGREQGAAQFGDRQQRRQARDRADHLQDDHGGETSQVRA